MRLLSIVAATILSALAARAEEWISDQYRCALNTPPEETWQRGNATPLNVVPGDLIFSAVLPETKQRVAVTVTRNVVSKNLQSPAIVARIMECMQKEFGLSISGHKPVEINGQSFLQVVGRRNEGGGESSFALARAALKDNSLYIVMTLARGEEDRTEDKVFTRVLDTFRFLEDPPPVLPQSAPFYNHYRLGMRLAGGAAVNIAIAFGVVMFLTRRRAHG